MTAILITGAAKRIGKAIAICLAQEGYDIAVHYNTSPDAAKTLCASLIQMGVKAAAVQADLADEAAVSALVDAASQALGVPLTGVINNASLFQEDDWDSAQGDLWHCHHAINLRAPFLLARALAHKTPATSKANVINIVDQRVWKLNPQFFSYMLSKSALWTMTQTLAQALAPNIRVNAVGPGPVLQSIHQDSETFDQEAAATLLEQAVEPEEIAQACLYLLKAQKVTGQMIAVDSGQHLC